MKPHTRPSNLAVLLAVLAAACQSMSGTPYKAEGLRLFTPAEFARVDEPGLTLLIGPLVDESSVVRFLGDRSRKLATIANILQVSLSSAAPGVELSRQSFSLRIPSGDQLAPLLPHQVLAAVSLPNDYWAQDRRPQPAVTPPPSEGPGGQSSQYTVTGTESSLFALSAVALGSVVENAGAKQYREAARLDVVQKTTLDRTLAANQTVDLLLVFVPPNGKISPSTPLEIAVELEVDGVLWAKTLQVSAR